MADSAPLGPNALAGRAFPPMPPEVEAAEKSTIGGGVTGPGGTAAAVSPVQPMETHRDKWGEA